MRMTKMMLRVAGLGVVFGMSGCAWAQEQAEVQTKEPAEVHAQEPAEGEQAALAGLVGMAASAFERAGFEWVASKEDFSSVAAVSRTQEGLVQFGVSAADGWRVGSLRAWRLKDGALDRVPTPDDLEGRSIFGIATSPSGLIVLHDMVEDDDTGGHLVSSSLNLLGPDGRTEAIKIEEATILSGSGVNDQGVVVGCYTVTGRMIAYCWSARFGMRHLIGLGLSSVANAISNEGVIVGQAIDPQTSRFRAMVWSVDGEGEALPVIEGFESSNAVMADRRGRVLVSHFNTKHLRNGKELQQFNIGQAYVWEKGEGYTRVQAPEGLSTFPLGMSDRGEVLLRCTEAPSPSMIGTILIGDYYLSIADRVVQLPPFPGALQTRYLGISPGGYISGVADFQSIDGQPTSIAFVIRVKKAE